MTAESMRKYLDVTTETGRANRKNFNRKRVLMRVKKSGNPPFTSTMKEYAIEPYEVNAALVAGNHEPLTTWDNSGDTQPRFTGQIQAHNEEVKRLMEEFAKTKIQPSLDVERTQKELKVFLEQHKDTFVEAPAESCLFYGDVSFVFHANSYRTGLTYASQKTIEIIFGKKDAKQPGKSGRLYQVFKKYSKTDCIDNVKECLKNLDDILIEIQEDQTVSERTKIAYYHALYTLMTHYGRQRVEGEREEVGQLEEEFPEMYELLRDVQEESIEKANAEDKEKKQTEFLQQDWTTLMDKVKRTFGKSKVFNDVKANLYFQIYNAFPSRDDLGFLKINPKISASNPRAEKQMNYIYKRQGATNWTIKLNKFKTTKLTRKKNIPEDVLPTSVSKLIDAYLKRPEVGDQEYLFMKTVTKNGVAKKEPQKQSAEIKAWLNKAGIQGKGSVNLLRHTMMTHLWKEEYDPEAPSLALKKLAVAFRHSVVMSKKYVRSLASELTEDSVANYDDKDLADKDEQEFSSLIPKTLVQATRMTTRSQTRKKN